MTLIDYFNQFWKEDEEKHFTQAETRLYTYLLYLWNSTGRKEWFECKTSMIEHYADINPMTITRCRKSLKDRGLINFKQGSTKGKYPYYSLLDVKDNVKDNVKEPKEKVSPTPPLKENNIELREKETSSNEEEKTPKEKSKSSKQDLPSVDTIDESKNERMDWKAFEDFYNSTVSSRIPKIDGVNDRRRRLVKAVIKTHGKESIRIVLNYVINSPWHTGQNDRGWKADFDWIFKPDRFNSLLEKAKDNGAVIQRNATSSFTSKQEANEYALNQFIKYREARENGLLDEVEKPF